MAGDMYTRKVFWEEPYRTQLETTVTTATADEVTLASTIFFAFSGGQESDRGTIGNLTLKRRNVGRGKERIEIYLDSR